MGGSSSKPTDDKIATLNAGREWKEIANVIGVSFAGDPSHDPEWSAHWALGPHLADRADPRRAELVGFWLSFAVLQHGHPNRGLVLGIRDDDGKLVSVIVARRMKRAKHPLEGLFGAAAAFSVLTGGVPKAYTDAALRKTLGEGLESRTEGGPNSLLPTMSAMHEALANHPHWYVAVLAVVPSAQGKGHGAALMRAITGRADAEGLPCYLESSGPRNRAIYKHLGYETLTKRTLEGTVDEEGWGPYTEFDGMVRPAKKG